MPSHGGQLFEELIRSRTEADFVERRWLHERIESDLDSESCRIVLVTGEPGAGKTSLSCGLARQHDDWLRYFISERLEDGTDAVATGDIASFLISIGLQLSHARPELFAREALEVTVEMDVGTVEPGASVVGISIDDLIASPFHRNANTRLSVGMNADTVRGSMIGVEIARAMLEPRLLELDNLAHLALLGPALALHDQDPDARITIILDALDEASRMDRDIGLLHWLATGPRLPNNVRVVVASRQQSALGLLRYSPTAQTKDIPLDPADHRVADDLVAYAEKTLTTAEVTRAAQDRELFPDHFLRQAARRADGNFLYLASYVRALKNAIDSGDAELADQLFKLDDLPKTLSGIYGFFIELARSKFPEGWMLDIQNPISQNDRITPAWEGVGKPVLGVLAVAREPLTEDQLIKLAGVRVRPSSVHDLLARLRWLLDWHGERIALFHLSVGEFLTGPLAQEKHPDCWLDPVEWNEQIARYYRGSARIWGEVEWPAVDRYGLAYLAEHVLNAEASTSDTAVDLICGGFLQAVRAKFGVVRPFLNAVDQVAHHIIQTRSVKDGLNPLLYLGMVRNQAARKTKAVPARVLGLMARVGRLNEALERTAELTASFHQFAAMLEIARYAECRPGDLTREDLNERVIDYALTVPQSGGLYNGDDALKYAAQTLAPHDLDRALRLWERAQQSERKDSKPPDSLYRRAAAATRDPAGARALIGKLGKDQWRAYLDLAGRIAEPALVCEILADAERSLHGAPPVDRVCGLAELARKWSAFDRDNTARLAAELRAEVFQAGEAKALPFGKAKDLPQALADAAAAIEPVDTRTARMLLTRLDLDPDVTAATLITAAVLWTNWGETRRACAIASRIAGDGWGPYGLRSALGELSRETALEMLEEILAASGHRGAAHGSSEDDMRTFKLISVVDAFAEHDLRRAAEIARQVPRTEWYWGGYEPFPWLRSDGGDVGQVEEIYANDRYSILAGIAHLHLNRGERAEAMAILEEALAFYPESAGQLATDANYLYERGTSREQEERLVVPPAQTGITYRELDGVQAAFNASQNWRGFVKQRFFRDPADLVRAASTSPGSLAKTLRVVAEQLSSRDRVAATRIVRALDDTGERAIGMSTLHRDSHDPDHGPDSERFSHELDRALMELPSYRWTASRWPSSSRHATNYARPDIRVRFEVALPALNCRKQDAGAIEEFEYLSIASKLHTYLYVVDHGITDLLEREHFPVDLRSMLSEALSPNWFQGQQGEQLIDCTRAAIAYREFRMIRELPGYAPIEDRIEIANPIYATAMALVAPTSDGLLSPAFTTGIRRLLWQERVAAAVGLLAFAAEIRPEGKHTLLGLAGEAIRAAGALDPAHRIEVLSHLAAAPVLAELLDPAELLDEAERAESAGRSGNDLVEAAIIRLFPALLKRSPSVALRAFYQASSTRWSCAMSLLESTVGELIELFGPQFAEPVARSVQQGLACVAPDGAAPRSADGVSFARLLPHRPEEASR